MTETNIETDDQIDGMAAGSTPDDHATLAPIVERGPSDAPADPVPFDLPPEVLRLAQWIIGTGLFPDAERVQQWLEWLEMIPRPWMELPFWEHRAKVLVHFTAHLTGADERTRGQFEDVRQALGELMADPSDDNPILTAGCGTVTAARVAEMWDRLCGCDGVALDRRAEELRALFEADESYRLREAFRKADKWKPIPNQGPSPYGDESLEWFVSKHVKVGFMSLSGSVEKVWVVVKEVEGGRLVGELLDDPVWIRFIQPGDCVELKRYHVRSVVEAGDDS